MHGGAAPGGELLLTDPSLLPQRGLQAQFRAPRSPDAAGSYYRQDLPPGLRAYQVPSLLLRRLGTILYNPTVRLRIFEQSRWSFIDAHGALWLHGAG